MKQDLKTRLSFYALFNCLCVMDESTSRVLDIFEAMLMTTADGNNKDKKKRNKIK